VNQTGMVIEALDGYFAIDTRFDLIEDISLIFDSNLFAFIGRRLLSEPASTQAQDSNELRNSIAEQDQAGNG
jgi:hypothetical protein